jgi:hypothetical protein
MIAMGEQMEILANIPIAIDVDEVRRRLHLKREEELKQVEQLVDAARACLQPQGVYKVCFIEKKLEDAVMIEGLRFSSKVLRKNLDSVERIFPYVVTIGKAFDDTLTACTDLLEKFFLDTIGNVALHSVRKHLTKHLQSKYAIGKVAFMNPGSLADWPIQAQKPLFDLLGDVNAAIGVKLTNSLLMLPAKSLSGILFPTEVTFHSCQLCPRARCESRKAKYNEPLARDYGIKN